MRPPARAGGARAGRQRPRPRSGAAGRRGAGAAYRRSTGARARAAGRISPDQQSRHAGLRIQ